MINDGFRVSDGLDDSRSDPTQLTGSAYLQDGKQTVISGKQTSYDWQRKHRIVIRPCQASNHLDIELPSLRDLLRIVR